MRVADLQHTREVSCRSCSPSRTPGKIRFLAASEAFASDHGHDALGQSLDAGDDWYDVLMVGHNLVQPVGARSGAGGHRGARHRCVRDVRRAQGPRLGGRRAPRGRAARRRRAARSRPRRPGRSAGVPPRSPAAPASLPEAAYRFARHEPGCHVVLTGTGSVEHLAENVASINGPPLPPDHLARLATSSATSTPSPATEPRPERFCVRQTPLGGAERTQKQFSLGGGRSAESSQGVEDDGERVEGGGDVLLGRRPADGQAEAAVGVDAHGLEHG